MNEVGASPTSALPMRKRDVFNRTAVLGFAPDKTECAPLALLRPALPVTTLAEFLYLPYTPAVWPARHSALADSHRPSAQHRCAIHPFFLALKNMKDRAIKDLHKSLLSFRGYVRNNDGRAWIRTKDPGLIRTVL